MDNAKAQKPKSPKAQKPLSKTSERIKIPVEYTFLAHCAANNSSSTLNMFNPEKSTGKLISYSGKLWVCTGSSYKGEKCTTVWLREVIEAHLYKGLPNNPNAGPEKFYIGGLLKAKKQKWIMIDREIELIPAIQLTLF